MSELLDRPFALDGLVEHDGLTNVIEKVGDYAPLVSEQMKLLAAFSEQITQDRLDAFAEQSLDLRRTNMAILIALLHDGFLGLGALLTAIDLDEWFGQDEAITAAEGALAGLVEGLADIVQAVRPGRE